MIVCGRSRHEKVHVESTHYHFPAPSYVHMDGTLGYSFVSVTQQTKFQTYLQGIFIKQRFAVRR